MNVLHGELLSIEEVAKYLEQFGCKYNLKKQYEYKRLYSKIYDLNIQSNVTVLFHYCGFLAKEVQEFEYDEDTQTGEPVKILLYEEVKNIHTNDYYNVNTELLKKILIDEKAFEIDGYISKYGDTTFNSQDSEVYYYLHNGVPVSPRALRILKCDLDKLFSVQNSELNPIVPAPTVTQTQSPNSEQFVKELAAAKTQIAELEHQQKAHISIDDEPTHHKSVGSMQALIATLIKMAEYDKANLADPYGELNKLIQAKAEILGLSVKKDFVAKWIKKADDVL